MSSHGMAYPLFVVLGVAGAAGCARSVNADIEAAAPPSELQRIFDDPRYQGATWGLRVVDLQSGQVLIDLEPDRRLFIGSVRKLFSVGELLEAVGPTFTYDTPVHRQGELDGSGVLHGDLVLVASGDLTMGGRTNPDGSIAVTNFDHNEANALGNAVLSAPDPLAGFKALAQQVAAAGVKHVAGEVVIDDRLFQPFNFRDEFDVRPIFVNDDVVDVIIGPTTAGAPASVDWRPKSLALGIENALTTGDAGTPSTLELHPELPGCIGQAGCSSAVTGALPVDVVPPLTDALPLIQTVRIVEPANYARTVFIEALQAEGVTIDAAPVIENPIHLLPARASYPPDTRIAELIGLPYEDHARLILKVSYNIGADTSLVLWGLTRGVDNMNAALALEREHLVSEVGIPGEEFFFVDGSGGGETTATTRAVTRMLERLHGQPSFDAFFEALPILGIDGSLSFVTDFEADPTLAGAKGMVRSKTGTYLTVTDAGLLVKGQAFAGYIDARSGRRLAYSLVVNNVAIEELDGLLRIFQDEGKISAILWRDF